MPDTQPQLAAITEMTTESRKRLLLPDPNMSALRALCTRLLATITLWFRKQPDHVLSLLVDRNTRLTELRSLYDQNEKTSEQRQGVSTSDADAIEALPDRASRTSSKGTAQRTYRLAATDLFVETALDLLDRKAKTYQRRGRRAYTFSMLILFFGAGMSFVQAGMPQLVLRTIAESANVIPTISGVSRSHAVAAPVQATAPSSVPHESSTASSLQIAGWIELLAGFTRAFTFYGFIVLLAVTLWRFGRAMLDQAERLHDRRHALRQGRLFVHLREGVLTIEEMERAFAWNISQANAFANILTEARAPWGSALSDLFKAVPDLVKAGADAARRDRAP